MNFRRLIENNTDKEILEMGYKSIAEISSSMQEGIRTWVKEDGSLLSISPRLFEWTTVKDNWVYYNSRSVTTDDCSVLDTLVVVEKTGTWDDLEVACAFSTYYDAPTIEA